MAKHKPGLTWMLRRAGKSPNGWVQTENEKEISVFYEPGGLQYGSGFICTRGDAKLIAKRILECLEGTK